MLETTTKEDYIGLKRKDTEENSDEENSGPNKKQKHSYKENNYLLVDTKNNLETCLKTLSEVIAKEPLISVDCEGVELSRKGALTVISVGSRNQVYLFDVLKLKEVIFDNGLRAILENGSVKKLMFDCREDADALKHQFNVTIKGVLDIQLLEVMKRSRQIQSHKRRSERHDEVVRLYSLSKCLEEYTKEEIMIQNKKEINALNQSKILWKLRPLPSSLLNYAAADVSSLFTLYDIFDPNDEENDRWKVASDLYVDLKRTIAERKYDIFEKNGYLPIDIIPEKNTLTFERGNVECTTCHRQFPRSEFSSIQFRQGVQKCRTCKKVKLDDDVQKNREDNWARDDEAEQDAYDGYDYMFDFNSLSDDD